MAILPKVKLKALVTFPGRVQVEAPLLLDTTAGVFTFSLDLNALIEELAATFEPVEANNHQEITSGATANVEPDANTVRVNKTVGGAITLTLPEAAFKTVPVLIVDFKGDAGTNNITVVGTGDETIQGLSSWVIGGDNASIFLRPIAGLGYIL